MLNNNKEPLVFIEGKLFSIPQGHYGTGGFNIDQVILIDPREIIAMDLQEEVGGKEFGFNRREAQWIFDQWLRILIPVISPT